MKIRIWTIANYIDITLKEEVDRQELMKAIDNGDTLLLKTIDDTEVFINNINVVMLEILYTPPIEEK